MRQTEVSDGGGLVRLPEIAVEPESLAQRIVPVRMAEKPQVHEAFQRADLNIVGRAEEAIRFRRCIKQSQDKSQ